MSKQKGKVSKQGLRHPFTAYEVDMAATAEAVYVRLAHAARKAEAAGNYASAHCTAFNMVREAIKTTIPGDPLNRKYALRGDLSNIFRLKKGRMRICWIASSKIQRVCILFISENLRKEGDVHDPYAIFQSLMDSGAFDAVLSKYGVKKP